MQTAPQVLGTGTRLGMLTLLEAGQVPFI